jgi:hypothetical protein
LAKQVGKSFTIISTNPKMASPGMVSPKGYRNGGIVEAATFDPEGSDYDYTTARKSGMGATGTGENKGHWGSVAPASAEARKQYNLPNDSYMVLKGRAHPTWDKADAAEKARGSEIKKFGDRYYSVPRGN